jgi:protein-glutamine gamma-glutamyltransferase
VEMNLPHSGWVTMDPTPPSLESINSGSPAWHALGRIMDTIRLQWSRFFVQYSAADQLAVMRELKAEGTSARNKAFDSIGALFSPFLAMLSGMAEYASKGTMQFAVELLGISLVCLAVLWLGIKRPWAKGMAWTRVIHDDRRIVQLYGRMVRHLARKGISKLAATAPLELVCLTRERWSAAGSSVALITELYCRTRFGQIPPTREELSLAEDHLRHLRALDKP